jgi:Bacteriophage baseplate protein W
VTHLDYPFTVDRLGRTATASRDDHVRDMIEQLLFTAPGERVNRPSFGCGILQLVFQPNGDAVAGATRMIVQGALQQWLGSVIEVGEVDVDVDDSTLRVTVRYVVRSSGEDRTETFEREVSA